MDLERDDDTGCLRRVGEVADVLEKGRLVLVGALVAADGGVHDRETVVGRPADRFDAVLQALAGRQVGVAAEADGFEPIALELPLHRSRIFIERDVLRPAGYG